MTENAIIIVVAITRGQAEAEVRSHQGLRPSSSFIIVVVVVVGIVVIVVVAETPPADRRRPIDGSPLAPVRCIGMCSTTSMDASSSSSSSSSSSRRRSPANLERIPPSHPPLASSSDERRRYRGTVDGVRGEARTRKINDPPRAVAEIDGVEVVGGGGVFLKPCC